MTIKEILRSNDPCGGCLYKNRWTWDRVCVECKHMLGGTTSSGYEDKYELDPALAEIQAKADKLDMIHWAINEDVEFVRTQTSMEKVSTRDMERLEKLYKERE